MNELKQIAIDELKNEVNNITSSIERLEELITIEEIKGTKGNEYVNTSISHFTLDQNKTILGRYKKDLELKKERLSKLL